jgi:hypothetical protein
MEGRFVKVGLGFSGVLLGSRAFSALRWTMPGMALGDVASRRWLYLAAKLSHVGVDVDSLACPLHRPMAYGHQMRGQSFLPGAVLSYRVAVGGGTILGDAKPPGLDIQWSVDCLGTCVTESYMK